jgi:hypothetical protein
MRVGSKDAWMLGYALRRLNNTVFNHNENLSRLVNTLIAVGAALRIVSVINSIATSLGGMSAIVKTLTGVWASFNTQLAQSAFWMGLLTAGVAVAAGLTAWAIAQSSAPKSFATTGTVPMTGMYMLHKGEVYREGNGPDYSQVNVYIQTGAINSRMDVENIFREMAIKTERERRRRGG